MKEELGNIKIGDKVYYRERFGKRIYIQEVTRLTKTMIICGKSRYKKSGYSHGDFTMRHIMPITKEIIIEYNMQRLKEKLKKIAICIEITENNYSEINDAVVKWLAEYVPKETNEIHT